MVTLAKRAQKTPATLDTLAGLDMSLRVGEFWTAGLLANDLAALWVIFGITNQAK